MKIKINNETLAEKLLLKIRLDFKAQEKAGRFFFGGKTGEAMAETVRQQQVGLLKNLPLQGIVLEDFDTSLDIYLVAESDHGRRQEAAYAPLVLTLKADSMEDVLPLVIRPEFRKIELLEPDKISLDKKQAERLLYSISRYIYKDCHKYPGQD